MAILTTARKIVGPPPPRVVRQNAYRNYVRNPAHSVGMHITTMTEMWLDVRDVLAGVDGWEASVRLVLTLPADWVPFARHELGRCSSLHPVTLRYQADYSEFATRLFSRWSTWGVPPTFVPPETRTVLGPPAPLPYSTDDDEVPEEEEEEEEEE